MASLPSASLTDLKNATEAELVREIEMHLAALNSDIADFRKAHHALQAQLLIQEITQKEQHRQTKTMVACTVIITVLTVVVAVLTGIMAWVTVFPSK